jgi:hypothetical protein
MLWGLVLEPVLGLVRRLMGLLTLLLQLGLFKISNSVDRIRVDSGFLEPVCLVRELS